MEVKKVNDVTNVNNNISETCEICCNTIIKTNVKDKYFVCKYCKYTTCNKCIKKYLIDYANITPKCPNCNVALTIDEVQSYLGSYSFNKFLQNSTKITLSIEKQKIQEVLEDANIIRQKRRFKELFERFSKYGDIYCYIFCIVNRDTLNLLYNNFIINDFTNESLINKGILIHEKYKDISFKFTNYTEYVQFADLIQILKEYFKDIYNKKEIINKCKSKKLSHIKKIYDEYYMYCNGLNRFIMSIKNQDDTTRKIFNKEDVQELVNIYIDNDIKIIPYNKKINKINSLNYLFDNNINYNNIIMNFDNNIIMNFDNDNDSVNNTNNIKTKIKYIFPCQKENCHGMINSNHECVLCKNKFCNKCLRQLDTTNEISDIGNNHICKQEDIDNYNFIMSTTKPCPNCATRIFKIEGCSQMFCTMCYSGFDYNTGKLITSNFHNPHRAEWLRTRTDNDLPENIKCGGDIRDDNFSKCEKLIKLVHFKNHINDFVNKKYIIKLNNIRDTSDKGLLHNIKVEYVINNINDKQLYNILRRIETKKHKYNQIIPLYTLFTEVVTNYLLLIHNKYVTIYYTERYAAHLNPDIKKYLYEINNLIDYINNELLKISKIFSNCMYYKINKLEDKDFLTKVLN